MAVALDTKGPEIRTGNMKVGEVELRAGHRVTVTVDAEKKNECDESLHLHGLHQPTEDSGGGIPHIRR